MSRGNPQTIKGKGFDANPKNINRKGRPKKLPELTELIFDEVGEAGFREILLAQFKKAKNGDSKAAEILLERGYGKTKQLTDITTNGKDLNQTVILTKEEIKSINKALEEEY